MDDPVPDIPAELCKIFREWAEAGAAVAEKLPATNSLKNRILQAIETIEMLGQVGAKNTIVLLRPAVTYAKIEFMANLMTALPPTPSTARVMRDAEQVRGWLTEHR